MSRSRKAARPDETVTLTVWRKPHAKQRPRLGRRRRAYTPMPTHLAENEIAMAYAQAKLPKFDGLVHVSIHLYPLFMRIHITPLGTENVRRLRGDIDNYAKTVLDALNTIAYDDDKQVASLWVVDHGLKRIQAQTNARVSRLRTDG